MYLADLYVAKGNWSTIAVPMPTETGVRELYKSPTATFAALTVLVAVMFPLAVILAFDAILPFADSVLFIVTVPEADPSSTLADNPILISYMTPTLNSPAVLPETKIVEVPTVTHPNPRSRPDQSLYTGRPGTHTYIRVQQL